MNTRFEYINGDYYCAYCGQKLRGYAFRVFPEPPLICNCDAANEEYRTWQSIKRMYAAPPCEKVIEMKIRQNRNELLGE